VMFLSVANSSDHDLSVCVKKDGRTYSKKKKPRIEDRGGLATVQVVDADYGFMRRKGPNWFAKFRVLRAWIPAL
jgi:hypothetical protein